MPGRRRIILGRFEVVLIGGAVAAMFAHMISESAFTLTIISVAILAVVALFRDAVP